jgi:hypothetical protein
MDRRPPGFNQPATGKYFDNQENVVMDYSNDVAYQAEPMTAENQLKPLDDLFEYLREYARERPEIVALTCFGVGFVLGWKLKPW